MNISKIVVLKDSRKIKISNLTPEICDLNNNYGYMHRWLHQVNRFLLKEFNPEKLERDKKEFFKKLSDPEALILGGFYGGKIIAQARLHTLSSRKKICHVGGWSIMIHPTFQHQGLGEMLLNMIEDIAKEKGLKRLEAKFVEGNKAAEELYITKMNYQVEGCKQKTFLLDNSKYVNEILIAKIL